MVVNTQTFKIQTEGIRKFQAEDTGLNNAITELKTTPEEFNSRQMKQENRSVQRADKQSNENYTEHQQ